MAPRRSRSPEGAAIGGDSTCAQRARRRDQRNKQRRPSRRRQQRSRVSVHVASRSICRSPCPCRRPASALWQLSSACPLSRHLRRALVRRRHRPMALDVLLRIGSSPRCRRLVGRLRALRERRMRTTARKRSPRRTGVFIDTTSSVSTQRGACSSRVTSSRYARHTGNALLSSASTKASAGIDHSHTDHSVPLSDTERSAFKPKPSKCGQAMAERKAEQRAERGQPQRLESHQRRDAARRRARACASSRGRSRARAPRGTAR